MFKILIISFSDLYSDPRVNRQIRFLSDHYSVTTLGITDSGISGVTSILTSISHKSQIKKLTASYDLLTGKYEKYYWTQDHIINSYEQLKNLKFDLIIANDIDSLPLAIKIQKQSKLIFDAHEYAPREFEDRLIFRLLFQKYKTYLCQTYIPQVDRMITVCQSIADTYEKDTSIKPSVMTNAPKYQDLNPQFLTSNTSKIRLIHHGAAMRSRKIEKLIMMMKYLDNRYELNLILTGSFPDYTNYLKKISKNNTNIIFLNAVPMPEISQYLNKFDIGVYILEPSNFNNLHALPNKFFEFVQARLAVAIGPSPEMARLVKEYDLGVVADDFEPQTLAKKLMELDYQKINYYKQQSHKIAKELSADKNQAIILNLVQDTLNNH